MSKPTTEIVAKRAVELGFTFTATGGGSVAAFKVTKSGTGYGYMGTLDGCFAYLQGWDESIKFNLHRW